MYIITPLNLCCSIFKCLRVKCEENNNLVCLSIPDYLKLDPNSRLIVFTERNFMHFNKMNTLLEAEIGAIFNNMINNIINNDNSYDYHYYILIIACSGMALVLA